MIPALLTRDTLTLLSWYTATLLTRHIATLLLGHLSLDRSALLSGNGQTSLGWNPPGHTLTLLTGNLAALLPRNRART